MRHKTDMGEHHQWFLEECQLDTRLLTLRLKVFKVKYFLLMISQWHAKLPVLSCLAKKLVDISGDPRERQWFHQRLSLAVVRENTTSILACVQV